MRRRVAEHMVRSLARGAARHDVVRGGLDAGCSRIGRGMPSDYEARGARLTLTAYFVSACVRALRAHPEVNATFHADALELHSDVNIGVGTALGNKGLIVPGDSPGAGPQPVRDRAAPAGRWSTPRAPASSRPRMCAAAPSPFRITGSAAACWPRPSSSTSRRWPFSASARWSAASASVDADGSEVDRGALHVLSDADHRSPCARRLSGERVS